MGSGWEVKMSVWVEVISRGLEPSTNGCSAEFGEMKEFE